MNSFQLAVTEKFTPLGWHPCTEAGGHSKKLALSVL
jgi:hypothetical protein